MNLTRTNLTTTLCNYFTLCCAVCGAGIFFSCAEEGSTISNSSGNPLSRVYILYEGSSINTDYAFYDIVRDSLSNDVFKTANSGQSLGLNPGDMRIQSNMDLYITCRGPGNSNGSINKINTENNHLIASLQFGVNPKGFMVNNDEIFVANIGADFVTKLNTNLSIITDSIITGPQPSNILYGFNKYVVCKSSLTSENSLAAINEINNVVTKIYFDFAPVSSTYNIYGYFISSNTRKAILRLDPDDFHKIDSIVLPTQFGFIGDIFKRSPSSFYVIAGNKEVWLVEINSLGEFTATLKVSQNNEILIGAAAYEESRNEIYIADNNNGFSNGEMHIYDGASGLLKRTIVLGGRNPVSIAFRY